MNMKKKRTLAILKEKEKEDRRKIIIDAAETEFASKPFNKVNMRDIAKRAGISPALIYRHFPDRQSLFVETFMLGINDVFDGIYKKIDDSPDGCIREVAAAFVEFFTNNEQYFQMMLNFFLNGKVDANLFDKLNVHERRMLDNFDKIFNKMNFKNSVRINSHTFFASMIGIVATFRNHPEKDNEEVLTHRKRIADNLAMLFINMSRQ